MPVEILQRCHGPCGQLLARAEHFDTWLLPSAAPEERRRVWDRFCRECRAKYSEQIRMETTHGQVQTEAETVMPDRSD